MLSKWKSILIVVLIAVAIGLQVWTALPGWKTLDSGREVVRPEVSLIYYFELSKGGQIRITARCEEVPMYAYLVDQKLHDALEEGQDIPLERVKFFAEKQQVIDHQILMAYQGMNYLYFEPLTDQPATIHYHVEYFQP